ncbi:hypothetical protein KI387_029391, partial [Taxus chinensis]
RTSAQPNYLTSTSVLPACVNIGEFKQGLNIKQALWEYSLSCVRVASALVIMYVKCGSMHLTHKLFDKMPKIIVVSWTIVIAVYAEDR